MVNATGKQIMKTSIQFDKSSGKYTVTVGSSRPFKTAKKDYIEWKYKQLTGVTASFDEIVNGTSDSKVESTIESAPRVNDEFGINDRFGFVEKLVRMVAAGVQPSAMITGAGGLGKTYTVIKTLEAEGYKDISNLADFQVGTILNARKCFTMVKGYSTPKGLYRTLFENNKSVIVFDDCDSVLKDPVALNLLKGALDSYGKRIISWNADFRDDDLPRSFEFTGRVIFISNLDQSKVDQAIRSRSMMIDLSMTDDQKIDRMEFIAQLPEFLPEYNRSIKTDALNLIRELKDRAREISLRTLISIAKIRASNDDWKDLAKYVLCK